MKRNEDKDEEENTAAKCSLRGKKYRILTRRKNIYNDDNNNNRDDDNNNNNKSLCFQEMIGSREPFLWIIFFFSFYWYPFLQSGLSSVHRREGVETPPPPPPPSGRKKR